MVSATPLEDTTMSDGMRTDTTPNIGTLSTTDRNNGGQVLNTSTNLAAEIGQPTATTADGQALVRRYRPTRFEQVIGQRVVVDYLSGLIKRGQVCRQILLFGAVGSGKTTCARIFAVALNCVAPVPETGSPCCACESCLATNLGDARAFLECDAPRYRSFAALMDRIDRFLEARQDDSKRLIAFVDEAHALDSYGDDSDALLKLIEEPPPNVSFIFATTSPERLPAALRSRLKALRLRPLGLEASIGYLSDIAASEAIPHDKEALALLAGLGDGQPRNMLQALDQVSDGGAGDRLRVTRERVVDMFGVSRIEQLCNYFVALGKGDFAAQTKRFFEWHEPVVVKAQLIQQFLLSLYLNDIRNVGVPIDALISSTRLEERQPVLEAFRRRVGAENLLHFIEDMIAGCPVVTPATSDEAVLGQVIELQRLGNRTRPTPRLEVAPVRIPQSDDSGLKPRVRRLRGDVVRRRGVQGPKTARDPNYLTIDNVARLINSASFAVAHYGTRFNVRISIRHGAFGCKNQDEAADHFALFSKGLDSRLKDWTGAGHRLGVQEVNDVDGFCGRIVAFVPDVRLLQRWAGRWHREDRVGGQEDTAVVIDMDTIDSGLEAHWRCVRWICGGLQPTAPDYVSLGIEPEFQRAAGNIGTRTRMPISDSLKPGEIERIANELGLQFVSAFDDQAYEHLYEGWELTEHLDRVRHGREREAALAALRERYEPIDSAEQQSGLDVEIAELRASWPNERERSRSWTLWAPR
jgi:DNA polymerase III subunit gamma/tau